MPVKITWTNNTSDAAYVNEIWRKVLGSNDPYEYLDQVAIDFPELKIVGGHIGYPWTQEMIAVCNKHPNVYIDTSAYTVKRYPPELVHYLKGHGRSRVLFGTNWPMIPAAQALSGLADLNLGAEVESLFLAGNANAVYDLGLA